MVVRSTVSRAVNTSVRATLGSGGGASGGGGGGESFVLDAYAAPVAAWSDRQVLSGATSIIRGRRSSDSTESDFTDTELTDGTLTTFAASGDVFTAVAYAQAGANNLVQPTSTLQPRKVISGVAQTGVNFDGTDDRLGATLSSLANITVMAWVRNTSASWTRSQGIIGVFSGSNQSFLLYVLSNGLPYWLVNTGTIAQVNGSTALPLNSWHHIAGTFDGANMRLYCDGVQIASTAKTGSLSSWSAGFEVGRYSANNGFCWRGNMRDWFVWDQALSSADIAAIYGASTP